MKNIFLQITLSLGISMLLLACGSKTAKIDPSTKKAEKVIDQLHELLSKGKYEETHVLFSDKFKEVNDWKQIHVVYDSTAKLGEIKMKKFSTAEASAGPNGSTLYNLVVDATRTKINSTEQYHLEKEGDDVKIVSFKVLAVPFVE